MATSYRNDVYMPRLAQGLEFQDYVAEKLYAIGLPLFNYASKKYQCEHGENKLGVEIKFDDNYAKTGNLYIEVAEKSDPNKPNWTDSGVKRNDQCWLYVIGNYETLFVFSKRFLAQLGHAKKNDGKNRYKEIENGTKTSRGFLLPDPDARLYAAKVIE